MPNFLFIANINNPYGGGHDHIVHEASCQDRQCKRELHAGDFLKIEAASLQEAEAKYRADWYGDFDEESQWMFSADVKPCALNA